MLLGCLPEELDHLESPQAGDCLAADRGRTESWAAARECPQSHLSSSGVRCNGRDGSAVDQHSHHFGLFHDCDDARVCGSTRTVRSFTMV
jgi:hypothetical protein